MLFQSLLLLFQRAQAAQLHLGEVLEGPKCKQHLPGARGEHEEVREGHLGTPEWHLSPGAGHWDVLNREVFRDEDS